MSHRDIGRHCFRLQHLPKLQKGAGRVSHKRAANKSIYKSKASEGRTAVLPVVSATIRAGIVGSVQAAGVNLAVGGEVEPEALGDGVALGRAASFAVVGGDSHRQSLALPLAFLADVHPGLQIGCGSGVGLTIPNYKRKRGELE